MKYVWSDYSKDFAKVVDSFLDEEAVKNTGCDEGFDVYYQYWIYNASYLFKKLRKII